MLASRLVGFRMLKWPVRALSAIQKLFEPLQEVDVYVEDVDDEAFYRCLINAATGGKVKVARVFGLGGRKAVIAAAAAHDYKSRRALFIVDGDLCWVRGDEAPNVYGLHQHEAYCVENLLLCEKALATLLSQEKNVTEHDAERLLGFRAWRSSVLDPLKELFAAFATVNEVDPAYATVSQGVGCMCISSAKAKVARLDKTKIESARDQALLAAEMQLGKRTVAARYKAILDRINDFRDPALSISGKDFLLPLIDFHLQGLGCKIRRKSFRIRLAGAGLNSRFEALSDRLNLAARGGG